MISLRNLVFAVSFAGSLTTSLAEPVTENDAVVEFPDRGFESQVLDIEWRGVLAGEKVLLERRANICYITNRAFKHCQSSQCPATRNCKYNTITKRCSFTLPASKRNFGCRGCLCSARR
ncbi:hypothetical protein V2G26_018820 [Clonostachys chloroleuca]